MAKIVLIGCRKSKLSGTHPARELYTGDLFKKSLAYAETILKADKIFVLSALHGLIPLERKIASYDCTLNTMRAAERRAWADKVKKSLAKAVSLEKDTIVVLAGKKYYEYLDLPAPRSQYPLAGLPNGKRLQWLKNKLLGKRG
jgi:cytoplasmic iron level regulating protein YaaA (DUF328/UPF0246 family)